MKQQIKIRGQQVSLPITIAHIEEYYLFKQAGLNPLIQHAFFHIPLNIRIELNALLFGNQSREGDLRFYRYMWEQSIHVCEEYLCPLYEYTAEHISHILSRGAYPEMRYDTRNINILSKKAHRQWETGTHESRRRMNIWPQNQQAIKLLHHEYSQL